jgi:hypothetical protein
MVTKVKPSMMDLTVEVPLTGAGRLRGASDAGDSLTLVGGANDLNNRVQIRGSSHPTTPNTMTVDLNGSEALRFNASGHLIEQPVPFGHGTGAGGAVTQATSKSTGVTLNKPCGQITMNNAAVSAGAIVTFILTNSFITPVDNVVITANFVGGPYEAWAYAVESGQCRIAVRNNNASSQSDAVVLNFAVIKNATA